MRVCRISRGTQQVQFKASTIQRIPHSNRLLVDFIKPTSTSDYPLRSLFVIRILTTSRFEASPVRACHTPTGRWPSSHPLFTQDVLNPLVSNPLPYSQYYSSSPSYSREEFEQLQSLLETPPELESGNNRPCLLFCASGKPALQPPYRSLSPPTQLGCPRTGALARMHAMSDGSRH